MESFFRRIQDNIHSVQERIVSACARSARHSHEVRLIAVTKYAQLDWILALIDLGHRELAENRPQQLVMRSKQVPSSVTWHLIGHLQSNKAKGIFPVAKWIHSIDSLKLLQILDKLAVDHPERPKLLLEVNVTGEHSKDGFSPTVVRESLEQIASLRNIEVSGLMTMAPANENLEDARMAFRALRLLRDQLESDSGKRLLFPDLSMGMTGDFEVAIEEGATMVRIGSALFQGLDQ